MRFPLIHQGLTPNGNKRARGIEIKAVSRRKTLISWQTFGSRQQRQFLCLPVPVVVARQNMENHQVKAGNWRMGRAVSPSSSSPRGLADLVLAWREVFPKDKNMTARAFAIFRGWCSRVCGGIGGLKRRGRWGKCLRSFAKKAIPSFNTFDMVAEKGLAGEKMPRKQHQEKWANVVPAN